MKSAEDFVKYLFKRLPKNKLLAGTYYCGVTDSEIGTVPAHYLMGTTGQKQRNGDLIMRILNIISHHTVKVSMIVKRKMDNRQCLSLRLQRID